MINWIIIWLLNTDHFYLLIGAIYSKIWNFFTREWINFLIFCQNVCFYVMITYQFSFSKNNKAFLSYNKNWKNWKNIFRKHITPFHSSELGSDWYELILVFLLISLRYRYHPVSKDTISLPTFIVFFICDSSFTTVTNRLALSLQRYSHLNIIKFYQSPRDKVWLWCTDFICYLTLF